MSEEFRNSKTAANVVKAAVILIGCVVPVGLVVGIIVLILTAASTGINESERSKLGPLQLAACDGNVAECERLVKSGTPVDATDGEGDTALDWAVYYCHIDVVRKLIELGADVNHMDRRGGFTPLMYTAAPLRGHRPRETPEERNEIARVLIQHGADVNHADTGTGQTTLLYAASDGNVGLVRMLLAAGADPKMKSKQGFTPSDVASDKEVIGALEGR